MLPEIKFTEKGHKYTVNGKTDYDGVTSILSNLDKSIYLCPWYSKMTSLYLKDNVKNIVDNSDDQDYLDFIFDDAKKAPKKSAEKSQIAGKMAHKALENRIKRIDKKESAKSKEYMDNLFKWAKDNNIEFTDSEVLVCDIVYRYVGTFDIIGTYNGEVTIFDYKLRRNIDEAVRLQLAAYQNAYESMSLQDEKPWPKIVNRMSIKQHPDTGEIEGTVYTNYEKDIEVFKGLLLVQKWRKKIKNAEDLKI